MKSKRLTRGILLLLVILNIFSLFQLYNASAEVINESTSIHRIKNSKGQTVTTITMKDGIIEVVSQAHTATTNIRWKLVGFTITKAPVAEDTYDYYTQEDVYHLKGFKNVSTVYDQGYGTVWFSEGNRRSTTDTETDMTTTTTTIYAKQVENALKGEKFNNIVKNTPIYLHGIFCVYTVDKKGNEILHPGETEIRNWKEILLAEWWDRKDNQLDDFQHYFNMKIEFQPAPQDNTMNYYTESNQLIASKELEKKTSW